MGSTILYWAQGKSWPLADAIMFTALLMMADAVMRSCVMLLQPRSLPLEGNLSLSLSPSKLACWQQKEIESNFVAETKEIHAAHDGWCQVGASHLTQGSRFHTS